MSGADEVTRLPDSLQKFFKVTLGMEWPEGSEGGLKAMGGAWREFAKELRAVKDEVTTASRDIDRAMDGVTATNAVDYLNKDMITALEQLAVQADDLAKTAKTAAADIQKAKIMLIAMAAMALATIVALLASLFGALFTGPVIATTRAALQAILNQLLREIMKQTVTQVAKTVLFNAIKMGAFGAAFMFTLDAGIQAGQIAAGGRDEMDWDSVKGAVIGGAIGGAAAGVFHGVAKGLAKQINPKFVAGLNGGAGLSKGGLIALRLGGNAGYALGQVAMVAASNPVVNIATGGKGDVWDGLLGAMGPAQGMYKKNEYSGYGDPRGAGAKLAAVFDKITKGAPINPVLTEGAGGGLAVEGGPTPQEGQPVLDKSGTPLGTVFDPPDIKTESDGDESPRPEAAPRPRTSHQPSRRATRPPRPTTNSSRSPSATTPPTPPQRPRAATRPVRAPLRPVAGPTRASSPPPVGAAARARSADRPPRAAARTRVSSRVWVAVVVPLSRVRVVVVV
ncbi:hypothetical protein ACOBQX_03835 [Actinokineospora sp. G85]|uniref:WXG100-like domain-containing protein n=1 Tax=Actinokineospora sp. G85 TaxID=3406626 RepID=UPI003C711881